VTLSTARVFFTPPTTVAADRQNIGYPSPRLRHAMSSFNPTFGRQREGGLKCIKFCTSLYSMGGDQRYGVLSSLYSMGGEYAHPSSYNIGDRQCFISIVYYLSMSFTCLVCVCVCMYIYYIHISCLCLVYVFVLLLYCLDSNMM
jgi:hypothetical protein